MNSAILNNKLKTGWLTPEKKKLIGRYCTLYPLDKQQHAQSLYDAFLLDVNGSDWHYLPYGPFHSSAKFFKWLDLNCFANDPLFYAISTSSSLLQPSGMISIQNIKPLHGCAEIGHVHFAPILQRTPAATEVFYLMMHILFDELSYRRVEWKCDNVNQRSKYCATRLGFTFEGLFRQHSIYKSRNRDTAWFSIIDQQWPRIKAKFKCWLAPNNFDLNGQQLKSLADL